MTAVCEFWCSAKATQYIMVKEGLNLNLEEMKGR